MPYVKFTREHCVGRIADPDPHSQNNTFVSRIAEWDPHSVGPLDLASEWDPVPAIDRRKIFAKFTKEISNVEQKYWKRKIPKFHQK
jgi:hypothetical protein